jgi:AraC family transcriptional regulator, transcriptional activator of pobA
MRELNKFTDERQLFIEIRTLEWLSQNRPEQLTLPKRPGFMEIVWIKKAFGTCKIDLEKQVIGEDEIYCIGTRQLRHFQADGYMEGYYLSFAPAFINLSFEGSCSVFETRLQDARDKIRIVLEEDEFKDDIEQVIGKMMKEFSRPCEVDLEILRGLLLLLIIYLARHMKQEYAEPMSGRNHELINRFLLLLEKNLTTKKMVCDYAAELAISASYLNFIVKRSTGFTATCHIQQRKLLEAKKQIVWHGMSLKAVAYHLGFNDPAHFSKFFKAKAGMNFQNFRSGIQANNSLGF